MESSEGTSRRSERKRKRKESYSPEGKKEGGKKTRPDGQKTQNKSKLYSNRPYDVLPSGEPFSCHLCKSPYVVNPISKGVKKTGRSRHTPLPQIRTDRNTGREMTLCNACVQIFDRPQRRVIKTATVPSEDEKKEYLQEVEHFIKTLKATFDDPLVEKLFCPVSQKKLCGCLQKYIQSTGNSHVNFFITLMKEATELRKEKSYPVTDDNKKVKLIGLGNGHKKSKRYEDFVLTKRRDLKDDMRLCERATQKILMYSNNFLHKRLKTENRPCRVERTRGKAALGQLPDLHTMMDQHCCTDNCVMLALTHKRLLQDWRDRALQGQQEARRVMAEMLTPAGATHINCYSFISMVTGCSQTTIARVYNQMIDTGGLRDPPEHGMKRVWQDHYKNITKTSYGSKETNSSSVSSGSPSQEVTSQNNQSIQNTGIDVSTLNAVRQHKLALIQDIARKQLQQQQIALQLQDLMKKKKTHHVEQNIPTEQLHNKADDISHSHLVKATNNLPSEQLQSIPMSGIFGLNQAVIDGHGQILADQGQHYSGQSHLQHMLLQPPPQYGVHQSNLERQWNQSQINFPINVNQTNYLLTGDHQVLPVIPVFKQGPDGQVLSNSMPVTELQGLNGNQTRPVQISFSQNDTVQTVHSTDGHMNNFVTGQNAGPNASNSVVKDMNSLLNSVQPQPVKQYQIVSDQGVQLVNVPSSVIESNMGEQTITSEQIQSSDKPEGGLSSEKASTDQSESINPNIYFQFVSENPQKVRNVATEKDTSTFTPKPSGYEYIAKPLSVVEKPSERKTQKETNGYSIDGPTEDSVSKSDFCKTIAEQPVVDHLLSESSSTMIYDSVANQAGQVLHQTNQTQLIVPVSFFPSSDANGVNSEQIPSQIQISFQTCTTESNQPSLTQQIILPHGNIVTLPLIPVTSNKDVSMETTADFSTSSKENLTQDNIVSSDVVPDGIKNFSRENLQDGITIRPKYLAIDKGGKTEQSPSKSRNCSGNSRKSRNSSGSSDKCRRSAVHFSDTDKLESLQEHGHSGLRPENLTDFHFVSKLNRSRHRQFSGNSEHGDRSRKSSGNSVFSETSSHTSGLTLSNLASPNIFLDKEKGIFFIQSIDGLDEIDNSHLADLIQAVEADQANVAGNEKHGRALINDRAELEELVQSDKLENENFDVSKNVHVGKPKKIKTICTVDVSHKDCEPHGVDSQNIDVYRQDIEYTGSNLTADFPDKILETRIEEKPREVNEDIVSENSESTSKTKQHYKRKSKQDNKKRQLDNRRYHSESKHKSKVSEHCFSNTVTQEDRKHSDHRTPSKSFVPIAPKISQKSWNEETTVLKEPISRLSHNAPVLSSLLARKPIF